MWTDSFFWIMAACMQRTRFPAGFACFILGSLSDRKVHCVLQFTICSSGRRQLQPRKVLYVHREKGKKKNHFHLSASVHSPLKPTFQEGIQWCSRISKYRAGIWSSARQWHDECHSPGARGAAAAQALAAAGTEYPSLLSLACISAGEAETWARPSRSETFLWGIKKSVF